jgi:hypothetical protein
MFGGGGRPEEYVALANDPSTLFCGEGIPMTGRVAHIHSPNRTANKAISAHRGRVVITPNQLVVLVGRRLHCHATFSADEAAPLALSFRTDGLTIDLDVAKALPPKGSGTGQVTVKLDLPETVLAQLPSRDLRAAVPDVDVLSMTRWI